MHLAQLMCCFCLDTMHADTINAQHRIKISCSKKNTMASESNSLAAKRSAESVLIASAKKAKTSKKVDRARDIEKIKLLIQDIKDVDIKVALESIVNQSGSSITPVVTPKKMDDAQVRDAANKVIRKVQANIKAKLKWKNSFCSLKDGNCKGARVESVCNSAEVFEEIFKNRMGGTIKTSKDGKMSCSFKTDDEVKRMEFSGPSYRYNSAVLRAPFTASLKDNTLTFGFKFTIW